MKILHELNQLECGGAERIVESIIRHDSKNKHTVYSYKEGPMRAVLEAAGATVLVQTDDSEIIDMDCDLVHIHTGGSASLIASCVKGQLPTIETVHSPVASAVRDEWVSQRIGVSNVVSKLNRKCKTIYNGINLERLIVNRSNEETKSFRQEHGIPEDAFVVGRLGRIAIDKCLEEWLLASKKFVETGLCKKPYFLIVGDEPENYRGYLAKLKVMAASLPLRNVVFVPATEEIGRAFSAMDVFMYPSPTEGFGLAYIEAMAAGVPTLLWENDLTKELCLGAAALCKNTVKDLAETLAYLFIHQDIRLELGHHGRQIVLSQFTSEIMSAAYQELYEANKMEPVDVI